MRKTIVIKVEVNDEKKAEALMAKLIKMVQTVGPYTWDVFEQVQP